MTTVQGRGAMAQKSQSVTVKGPQRFKPSTQVHSGVNPLGSFSSFMSKDAIKNIDVRRDDWKIDTRQRAHVDKQKDHHIDKIPTGTTTHTFLTQKLAKTGKLNRDRIETKDLPRNKTDYVSYEPPTNTRPQQKVFDQMMTKPRYAKNHQSTVPWMPFDNMQDFQQQSAFKTANSMKSEDAQPSIKSSRAYSQRSFYTTGPLLSKTLNNRSSVHHNIITGQNNGYSHEIKPGLLDKQVCNRKLGITQIRDLSGPNAINRNPDYVKAHGGNDSIFKRQNGIFTHLYNAAHRFGETEVFKASSMKQPGAVVEEK